ncbi:hypothetical protein G7046_g5342 [Stylonectria norvegica]|nr:hypothetical protein G7046_g5342 [Stylonectria norvegica]
MPPIDDNSEWNDESLAQFRDKYGRHVDGFEANKVIQAQRRQEQEGTVQRRQDREKEQQRQEQERQRQEQRRQDRATREQELRDQTLRDQELREQRRQEQRRQELEARDEGRREQERQQQERQRQERQDQANMEREQQERQQKERQDQADMEREQQERAHWEQEAREQAARQSLVEREDRRSSNLKWICISLAVITPPFCVWWFATFVRLAVIDLENYVAMHLAALVTAAYSLSAAPDSALSSSGYRLTTMSPPHIESWIPVIDNLAYDFSMVEKYIPSATQQLPLNFLPVDISHQVHGHSVKSRLELSKSLFLGRTEVTRLLKTLHEAPASRFLTRGRQDEVVTYWDFVENFIFSRGRREALRRADRLKQVFKETAKSRQHLFNKHIAHEVLLSEFARKMCTLPSHIHQMSLFQHAGYPERHGAFFDWLSDTAVLAQMQCKMLRYDESEYASHIRSIREELRMVQTQLASIERMVGELGHFWRGVSKAELDAVEKDLIILSRDWLNETRGYYGKGNFPE